MGYYTRAFCKSDKVPRIKEILDYLNSQFDSIYTNLPLGELESQNWNQFQLFYEKKKSPILVEINKVQDSSDLAREELNEFKEFIGKPRILELKKRKAIKHLNNTKYIICNQLPTSDINDKGYDVNWSVLSFFERNYKGMLQADNEGIYIDEKYLIPIT